MKNAINQLNKHSVAEATGISYSRLRKYSSGLLKSLTAEEQEKIYKYLMELANRFKVG